MTHKRRAHLIKEVICQGPGRRVPPWWRIQGGKASLAAGGPPSLVPRMQAPSSLPDLPIEDVALPHCFLYGQHLH